MPAVYSNRLQNPDASITSIKVWIHPKSAHCLAVPAFALSIRSLARPQHPPIPMADSPGSPLSSVADDDVSDREDTKQGVSTPTSNMPPSKRRRTGMASWDRNTPVSTSFQDELPPPPSPSSSISSDTSGEIPNSPNTLSLIGANQDEDYSGQCNDQVTVCRWEGCDFKDLGNMDDLVQHIHNEHVGSRQKKYSCEWSDCPRKGQTHASGYALRAHMRSHTREKPFYCALPGKVPFSIFPLPTLPACLLACLPPCQLVRVTIGRFD